MFSNKNKFLDAANFQRDWTTGRAVFHNFSKSIIVWVNEQDHLKIMVVCKGHDIAFAFDQLVRAHDHIE